ncbi:MAG TPA: biopolymer transporter ExbD [Candidatus Sulfotelmatobacter sp.]|nr:biopolymer transporter ExbD [Candidatus Sulfotelmatobacter sp.]
MTRNPPGYEWNLPPTSSKNENGKRTAIPLRQRLFRSPKLFSDFNTLPFASVTALVLFVILIPFMTMTTPHGGVTVDPPKVRHPVSMPGALREDAMKVAIFRDGSVYFGTDRVDVANLQQKIVERLKDRDVERKVYIRADKRTRWCVVKSALDCVRSAGILRVAFIVNQ